MSGRSIHFVGNGSYLFSQSTRHCQIFLLYAQLGQMAQKLTKMLYAKYPPLMGIQFHQRQPLFMKWSKTDYTHPCYLRMEHLVNRPQPSAENLGERFLSFTASIPVGRPT